MTYKILKDGENYMKKIKNICIRALCAVFVGVVLGCSGSDGGNDIENDGGNGGNSGNEQETGWKQPAYMNVTEEFGGQRFVEEKTNWLYDNQGYTKFTAHCDDADKYIDGKVVELQKLWEEKNTGSALSSQINTALNNFNNGTSIDEKITNNYTALAPVFVIIEGNLLNDTVNYYRYTASYHKLAANAYNKSLGHLENSPDNGVLTNKEMKNMPENFFVYELTKANLNYNELTVKKAQEIMNDTLVEIANNTNTETAVLKKVVELAMYNESLYGLTDLAKLDTVVSRGAPLRTFTVFAGIIAQERNNTKTQNIDDGRAM